MFELLLGLLCLIAGLALLAYAGNKAVEHSLIIALEWGVSPLMIGLLLVALGTDLPEIVNSILSSALGHGNINVGNTLGAALVQMSLALGLLPFLARTFKVRRKEVGIIGACEVLALMLAVSMGEKGNISHINGLFLVASWPIFMLLIRSATAKNLKGKKEQIEIPTNQRHLHHFYVATLSFVGIEIGSLIVIESVITLSAVFQISEYLISFFVVAIGTSLPELMVNFTAIRKSQYEIVIGNTMGSSIINASFAIGIGPLIFPIAVDEKLVMVTGLYAIFVSTVVILTLALREKIGKITGAFFIFLYLLSYSTLGA